MRGLWSWGDEHELVAFMWEMNTSLPGVGRPPRALNECAVNQMRTKEIWIMEIHSYCSHLKCLSLGNQQSGTTSSELVVPRCYGRVHCIFKIYLLT